MSRNPPNGGDAPSRPGASHRSSDSNGNGSVTGYRLQELERRVGALEGKVDDISKLCIEIKTKLEGIATKGFVWMVVASVLLVSIGSLVGHLLIRGAAHWRGTSCKAFGSVSAITRHNVESDGATQRRVFGSRQAPRARNSS